MQYRGGSELLVEAGDQRRVISLPKEIQGKVGGAKFMDRSLVITMRWCNQSQKFIWLPFQMSFWCYSNHSNCQFTNDLFKDHEGKLYKMIIIIICQKAQDIKFSDLSQFLEETLLLHMDSINGCERIKKGCVCVCIRVKWAGARLGLRICNLTWFGLSWRIKRELFISNYYLFARPFSNWIQYFLTFLIPFCTAHKS